MTVSLENVKQDIENMIATYDGKSSVVTYQEVVSAFPSLALGATGDAIFGSGDTYPTSVTPQNGVAEFAYEYLIEHSIASLEGATNSIIAKQLYDFYLDKFPTALYGLFSSIQELNRKYGGLDPEANQITDMIIQPSFVSVATESGTSTWTSDEVTGSFAQPAVNFQNVLTNASTSASISLGWVNHYFTIDTQLSAGKLYTDSPELNDISTFIVFGVLDRKGNVNGMKYANAKNNYTKPIYYGHAGLTLGDNDSPARIINNSASMYIGKSTYGYVGLDFNEPIAGASGKLTIYADLLGMFFSTAPTIQNAKY